MTDEPQVIFECIFISMDRIRDFETKVFMLMICIVRLAIRQSFSLYFKICEYYLQCRTLCPPSQSKNHFSNFIILMDFTNHLYHFYSSCSFCLFYLSFIFYPSCHSYLIYPFFISFPYSQIIYLQLFITILLFYLFSLMFYPYHLQLQFYLVYHSLLFCHSYPFTLIFIQLLALVVVILLSITYFICSLFQFQAQLLNFYSSQIILKLQKQIKCKQGLVFMKQLQKHETFCQKHFLFIPSLQITQISMVQLHLGDNALLLYRYSNWKAMKADKDFKQLKKNALMSFLEASATPNTASQLSKQSSSKVSEGQEEAFEQYIEELNSCNVCNAELDAANKKKCEFCNMPACNDHIRKRRKKKSKWQRICDNCQDKYLYDVYMKLQAKADEALTVEQQITALKHQNFFKEVQIRRQKRRQIGFKTMSLQQNYEEEMKKITDAQNKQMSFQHQVQSLELSVEHIQVFVQRASAAFKENNEESWNILSQENQRMAKELVKLEKKVFQIKSSIQKKEKDIQDAFEAWQQRQFKQKLQNQEKTASKKKEPCEIY